MQMKTICQNLMGCNKIALRGKFIALKTHTKKEEERDNSKKQE